MFELAPIHYITSEDANGRKLNIVGKFSEFEMLFFVYLCTLFESCNDNNKQTNSYLATGGVFVCIACCAVLAYHSKMVQFKVENKRE